MKAGYSGSDGLHQLHNSEAFVWYRKEKLFAVVLKVLLSNID